MKAAALFVVIIVLFCGELFAGGYAKPDQWGGFNGKDDATGENVTARPDNYGGYTVRKGGSTIEMKPDKYGGYRCNEYDKNYKKKGSYYLKPDGYGGYTNNENGAKVKKDKWGVYRWDK